MVEGGGTFLLLKASLMPGVLSGFESGATVAHHRGGVFHSAPPCHRESSLYIGVEMRSGEIRIDKQCLQG